MKDVLTHLLLLLTLVWNLLSSLQAPVIVDEDCDPSEPTSLQYDGQDYRSGPLAEAGLGAALLSMSGYEKTQEPYMYGK